jgi:hypothetical protein
MTSPLATYINSSFIIGYDSGVPSIIDGRYSSNNSRQFLVQCYLRRIQSGNTDTGLGEFGSSGSSKYPGYGIDVQAFLYRGYALRYSQITDNFELNINGSNEKNLGWIQITDIPYFMTAPGFRSINLRHGHQIINDSYIQILGGVYGSDGIDNILYNELGGIPITISAINKGI